MKFQCHRCLRVIKGRVDRSGGARTAATGSPSTRNLTTVSGIGLGAKGRASWSNTTLKGVWPDRIMLMDQHQTTCCMRCRM